MDWPSVPLGHITSKIGSGATPRGGRNSYKTEGVALIRSLNVYDLEFDTSGLAYIDEEQAAQLDNVAVQPGDVLLNITGASVARCALAPTALLPARVNQHVAILRPLIEFLDSRFLVYSLVAPRNKARLLAIAQGGATREALTKRTLEEFDIPLPPLPVQRKIAAVLAAYDELIENNLRRIEILEDMAQAVYREWFVNFRYPGHEDVPLVDSPLGPIPEGWKASTFGAIAAEVKDGVEPSSLEEVDVYIGLEHIPRESFTLIDFGSPSDVKSRKWRFEAGDVLFGRLRPYFHKVALARVAGVCSTDAIVIRPRKGFEDLVLQTAFSKEFVAHAVATSGGTDRPRAKWRDLRNFSVALPPGGLQEAFSEMVRPMVRLAQNLARQNSNLRSTRDLLLPKLVSGEIDVSDLDIDTDWLAA